MQSGTNLAAVCIRCSVGAVVAHSSRDAAAGVPLDGGGCVRVCVRVHVQRHLLLVGCTRAHARVLL